MSENILPNPPKEVSPEVEVDWLANEYKTRWKKSFDKLNTIKTKNSNVEQLQEFGRTIPALLEEINQPVGMAQTLIDLALQGLPDDEVKALLDDVIIDIGKETDYLKELHDSGVAEALTAGSIEQGKFVATLQWVEPGSRLYAASLLDDRLGEYDIRFHRLRVFDKIPTPRQILSLLAQNGKLPGALSTLEHELAHALQYKNATIFKRLLTIYNQDFLLDELHAFVAEATAAPFRSVELDQPDEIAEFVHQAYEVDHVDQATAVKACKRIMSLKLLGYDDHMLGELVGRAEYDEQTRSYPLLDLAIKDELAKRGINNSKDVPIFLNALLAQHEIKLLSERHKAMSIAAKRIASVARNPSWDQTKRLENS